MDLHEHLAMARSKIKPKTKEELSARGKANIQKRWDKYYKENPKKNSTSAPRNKLKPTE